MRAEEIRSLKDYRETLENLMKLPREESTPYIAHVMEHSPPVEQIILEEVIKCLKEGRKEELVVECETTLVTLKKIEGWLEESQKAEEEQSAQVLYNLTRTLHDKFGNKLNLNSLQTALHKMLDIIDELHESMEGVDVHNLPKENLATKKKINDVMYQ